VLPAANPLKNLIAHPWLPAAEEENPDQLLPLFLIKMVQVAYRLWLNQSTIPNLNLIHMLEKERILHQFIARQCYSSFKNGKKIGVCKE